MISEVGPIKFHQRKLFIMFHNCLIGIFVGIFCDLRAFFKTSCSESPISMCIVTYNLVLGLHQSPVFMHHRRSHHRPLRIGHRRKLALGGDWAKGTTMPWISSQTRSCRLRLRQQQERQPPRKGRSAERWALLVLGVPVGFAAGQAGLEEPAESGPDHHRKGICRLL